jgi:2-methylcitrate dehydratase PrpD
MTDSPTFPATHGRINQHTCVFERALISGCAVCELAARRSVGERETVTCASPLARANCGTLYGLLREKSAFALGIATTRRVLPHAAVMKVQCGGLDGLRRVFDPEAPGADVQGLMRAALAQHGSLDALPYSAIVQGVAAWQLRRRRG